MTVLARYEAAIAHGDITNDAGQRDIIVTLDQLLKALHKPCKFFSWRRPKISGIYLYGTVGTGKTFLMDLFYEQVTIAQKARFHFHHFMQQIDAQLRQKQGQKNPLHLIAEGIAKNTRLLCLDEFLVNDVAHAMILAELLTILFANGVILVATSNTKPDDLYRNGVQRQRFLPAIALIKSHCQVLALNTHNDYRLERSMQWESYFYPLNDDTYLRLNQQFDRFEPIHSEQGVIEVQKRDIPFIKKGTHTIWFDFSVICNLPRSQLDYLEIAERFDTIFVSNIPSLENKEKAFSILFVYFIDVLYDRGICLVVSAAYPLAELYGSGEIHQPFTRTFSRLKEMQSPDYARRHPRRSVLDLTILND